MFIKFFLYYSKISTFSKIQFAISFTGLIWHRFIILLVVVSCFQYKKMLEVELEISDIVRPLEYPKPTKIFENSEFQEN